MSVYPGTDDPPVEGAIDHNEIREEHVHNLARQVTQMSRAASRAGSRASGSRRSSYIVNPFIDDSDPTLDPTSEKFSARAWMKTLVHLRARDPDNLPGRTAGVTFRNLNVHGFGSATDYQKDVGNVFIGGFATASKLLGRKKGIRKIQILRDFDGLVKSGELLVVLGRPGSGCSTFLKTIAGETHGFYVDKSSDIQYQSIPYEMMHDNFRGEVIYNAETEAHFPNLTVGETLLFAAKARTPHTRIEGVSRAEFAVHMRDAVMAMYGLSHTINTRVGNDFIRGVSGGERKRVSIAETTLSQAPLQCWDNSTRGLDSATALEFIKTLRLSTEFSGSTALVAIYQASQSAYDLFDKAIVLYEGRQIYFGKTTDAKAFFTRLGFVCPERQTTGDFLTSLTNPAERIVAPGFEARVPRTPDEFAKVWRESTEYAQLLRDIEAYNNEYPLSGTHLEEFKRSRKSQQSKHMSLKSPYTISVPLQVKLCLDRGFQRLRGDLTTTYVSVFGNTILAIIIASVFYNMKENTDSFFSRGALLFFAVLTNAFSSVLEILSLYAQRAIVEKHTRYALYHPAAEAMASMIVELPAKVVTAIAVNLPIYFLSNLRREPGAFFIFFLFSFASTLAMSMIFRTIAATSRTLAGAMPFASIMILTLVIYTGFTIPTRDMVPWFRWLNYLNPIAYAFESLMVNEFVGRDFPCSTFVPSGPSYGNVSIANKLCNARGAQQGASFVSGADFLSTSYKYYHSHLWRNLGIVFAFMIFFLFTYLLATEKISAQKSKGEVLVFRRGHLPKDSEDDEESHKNPGARDVIDGNSIGTDQTVTGIQRQTKVFHWSDVCYDITIKGQDRRILDHVDGWVKPGTLTALMGASGAGKTTLLDVLATRTTMGVITGEMFVNGHPRDISFQRKTGYVQQQDLHLETSTVREALVFSALLRQSNKIPRDEKIAYVDEVIHLLEMESYAEAVIGVPGEGLNVEQRKRLTIAVELVGRPELLLFFDEPTSGLDSQTAWSICQLMRKLANNGQAILCTIHQPSALLIQEFDRLLFLAKGGKCVYFGELGDNSSSLTNYFEKYGAHPCPPQANPAEWMLEVIGAAPGHTSETDWHKVWTESSERLQVRAELARMKLELSQIPEEGESPAGVGSFAAPLFVQFVETYKRAWQQSWRTPSYIFAKILLSIASALFIGFSFYKAKNSQQGLQNQMFATFMLFSVFNNMVQQMHPQFVAQRTLYEARERPSKTYSWVAFMVSQILVEVPWQLITAVITFFSWYYPIGLYRNAIPTHAVTQRGGLMFLYVVEFFLFTSTFAHMTIAGTESAESGSNLAGLLFTLSLLFCGVLANGSQLGWWIWMNRVSPFTYFVGGMLSTGVANTAVTCSDIEFLTINPPSGQTCGVYLNDFVTAAKSTLVNPQASSDCQVCLLSTTNQFLEMIGVSYGQRWRNFGLLCGYILFNVFGAIFLYWLLRVPKKKKTVDTVAPPPIPAAEHRKISTSEK